MHRIGIDLGGTKIEGIVLDEALEEVYRKRIPTEQDRGYPAILENIHSLYKDLLAGAGGGAHSLGMGTPGALSPATGNLKNSNTVCMNGKPLQKDLEKLLGRPFELQNDANCFTLAEARLGAGAWKRVVFGVIMGTGCGGGISVEGKLITGLQRIAGEWGHMVLDTEGPACFCGANGCVETYISGGGLEKRWREEQGNAKSLPEILAAYKKGDAASARFISRFFARFGQALANVINIIDPEVVVLGGGVSNFDDLYSVGAAEVRKRIFTDAPQTPILRNKLGDSAGVIGAALMGDMGVYGPSGGMP